MSKPIDTFNDSRALLVFEVVKNICEFVNLIIIPDNL